MTQKQRSIIFVWPSLGPYHVARCEAVVRAFAGEFEVVAIELANKAGEYEWDAVDTARCNFIRDTLFSGLTQDLSPLAVFFKLRERLVHFSPAVIFLPSYWPAANLSCVAAALSIRGRRVMMNASHDGTAKATGVRHFIKTLAVRSFDAGLVGGSRHREHFAGMGLSPDRIFLGYDAVDNAYFELSAAERRPRADAIRMKYGLPHRYFLSLGRFVTKKNLSLIVDAYAILTRRHPDLPRLVFAGSGPCGADVIERAKSLGLAVVGEDDARRGAQGDVYIYPFKQITETPDLYSLASAFILASTEEEWGLVVNEAMASSLPVLVSERAGCARDLVLDGVTGYTFDPSSATQLAARMAQLFEATDRPAMMGAAARRHIAEWGCDRFAAGAVAATRAVLS